MYKLKKPLLIIAFAAMAIIVYLWIVNKGGYEPIAFAIDVILIPLISNIKDKKQTPQSAEAIQSTQIINVFNKPVADEFKVTINSCKITSDSSVQYRFQIDFTLYAYGRRACITKMILSQEDYVFTKQIINIVSVSNSDKTDYLSFADKQYETVIKKLPRTRIDELIVDHDEWKYLMITDYVTGERLPDGYEDFRLKGWKMIITYNGGQEAIIPFQFDIHPNSQKICSQYAYVNFRHD